LGKLLLQPRIGKSGWGQGRATGEPDWANVILCRPSLSGLDPFPSPTRHFRAGLLIVPSLLDSLRCFDRLVWSWAAVRSGVYWANCCCNPGLGSQVGVRVEPPKRLIERSHPVPSLSGLDPFPSPTRHFRAGLWGLFRPYGTGCVASIGLSGQRVIVIIAKQNLVWRLGQR